MRSLASMASGQNVEPRSRGAHGALTGPRPAAALRTEILIPLSVERVWLPIATRRRPSCPGNTDTEVSPMANNDQPTRAHHPHRTCRVGHRDRGPMAANARRGRFHATSAATPYAARGPRRHGAGPHRMRPLTFRLTVPSPMPRLTTTQRHRLQLCLPTRKTPRNSEKLRDTTGDPADLPEQ